ncbi:hypothetical protein QTO34_002083 [Cnephaeus nilssonii]|uniref:Kinetochore-associated protein DSN1 homolog n=1 Tax=Cnephaeus nilssonii TaxID=3371016 RepID=A0AA40LLI2_CNENI|nr:hypothetical protein QTO34_002083 [Eptesicus nilssonii]
MPQSGPCCLPGSPPRMTSVTRSETVEELSRSISVDLAESKRLGSLLLSSFQFSVQKLEPFLKGTEGFSLESFRAKASSLSEELKHFADRLESNGTLQKCFEDSEGKASDLSLEASVAEMKEYITKFSLERQTWDQLLLHYQKEAEEILSRTAMSMQQVHRCMECFHAPLAQAQALVTSDLEKFRDRLAWCTMHCNDKAKDSIDAGSKERQVKRQLESCVTKCVDNHMNFIPTMTKKMKEGSTETKMTEVEPTAYLGSSQNEVLNTKPDYQKILQSQNKVFDCMELVMDELQGSVKQLHAFMDESTQCFQKMSVQLSKRSAQQLDSSPARKLLKLQLQNLPTAHGSKSCQ